MISEANFQSLREPMAARCGLICKLSSLVVGAEGLFKAAPFSGGWVLIFHGACGQASGCVHTMWKLGVES